MTDKNAAPAMNGRVTKPNMRNQIVVHGTSSEHTSDFTVLTFAQRDFYFGGAFAYLF